MRVTELVAQGLPTAALAAQLHLSTYTIQDHLEAIFEKLGVSSRGELVARLFLDRPRVGGRSPGQPLRPNARAPRLLTECRTAPLSAAYSAVR